MRTTARLAALAATFLFLAPASRAQLPLRTEAVANGLTRPILVLAAPGDDQRLFLVEQWGRVKILRAGAILPTPFLDVSDRIASGGEQGLLGMAFHPSFDTNRHVFVGYTNAAGATVVERYTVPHLDPDQVDPSSAVTIVGPLAQADAIHNGGCLAFALDGTLFVAMGDGGGSFDSGRGHAPEGNGQSPTTLLGKMLRIDVDLPFPHVPPSNPYVGDPQVLDSIWAFGLREPWRFSFDRRTGDLWLGDVGQGESEEIDLVRYAPGGWGGPVKRNFGWRCMEGSRCTGLAGCVCHAPDLVAPIEVFDHSVGCAVIGGHVYRGCAIPSLRGMYVYATFCYGSASRVFAFTVDGPQRGPTIELSAALGLGAPGMVRITSFGEDAQGELYFCALDGIVRKIVPADPFPDCNANGVPDSCDLATGTSVDLDGNGMPDECDHREPGSVQPAPKRDRP